MISDNVIMHDIVIDTVHVTHVILKFLGMLTF